MEGDDYEPEFTEHMQGTKGDWDWEVFPGGDYSKNFIYKAFLFY